jgi:predicted site-specific integrase-resolvase
MELFKRKEVAAIFDVHPLTVRDWEKAGKIKPVLYVGLQPRYDIESIEKLATEKPTVITQKAGNGK